MNECKKEDGSGIGAERMQSRHSIDMSEQSGNLTERASLYPQSSDLNITIALVGQPNVGKSVIMNLLTGAGAMVSNYPGTTVEITEGYFPTPAGKVRIIDTPGIYSLHSDTQEQKVTQRILLEEDIDIIVNVVDARNLSRNLYLTLQLLELDIPLILVLNQMDMAEELGMEIDVSALSDILGVQIVTMVASKGRGLDELKEIISTISACSKDMELDEGSVPLSTHGRNKDLLTYSEPVENVLSMLQSRIEDTIPEEEGKHRLHPPRALAIHLMEHDSLDEDVFHVYPELAEVVESFQKDLSNGYMPCENCFRGCAFCPAGQQSHPPLQTCIERTQKAREIALQVVRYKTKESVSPRARIEEFLDRPSTGIPALILITLASLKVILWFLEFAEAFVPWALGPLVDAITRFAHTFPPGSALEMIISAIPEGLLLPFEVVMPTMISIYVIMALLEDSGLMPRIAVMMDSVMSLLKLPGQAIIPIVLGFGCRAPGVLATRALPDKQSRLVVTALLAIPIPCAATIGIVTGVAKSFGANLWVIYGSVSVVFVLLARLLAKYLKSDYELILEVPPIQIPSLKGVGMKVWMRLEGFFKQVLPVLIMTSIGIKILLNSGALEVLSKLDPISMKVFGIQGQSLAAVAVTVVQRYAAPMILLNLPLSAREATIATSMIALSMPCLPVSFLVFKEFGWKTLIYIFAIAILISLTVGITLNLLLPVF